MLSPAEDGVQDLPSLRAVNVLFLVSMVLVVTAGAALQYWSMAWGLIGTELLVLLVPALCFLRLSRLSPRPLLRLRWPGTRLVILSLVIGAGLWLLAIWLDEAMTMIFGYAAGVPPSMYPRTPGQAVLLLVGMALAAPICEEVLFRGVIQRGYERRGPWVGIVGGGLLFALYHFRFQGLVALLPIALVLGYVVWQSDSLITGMLVHFANNALGGSHFLLQIQRPDLASKSSSLATAIFGVFLAALGIWLFRRLARPIAVARWVELKRPSLLGQIWPLFPALLLFAVVAASELVAFGFPELLAWQRLQLPSAPWQDSKTWHYQVRTRSGEAVGNVDCHLSRRAAAVLFDCGIQQIAFEDRTKAATRNHPAQNRHTRVSWQAADLSLQSAESDGRSDGQAFNIRLIRTAEGLVPSAMPGNGKRAASALPSDTLLANEWPWRLSALPFQIGFARKVTLAGPGRKQGETEDSDLRVQATYVAVLGAEPLWTPAGNFLAWHVRVGSDSVWYDTNAPHTLLCYDDGVVRYLLINEEPH